MSKITDVGAAYDPQFERVEMSDKLRAAAKAALLALKCLDGLECAREEIEALEAALAEPAIKESLTVEKPVAWMSDSDVGFYKEEFGNYPCVPLYAAPPSKEWVGLTDEEILQLYKEHAKYQEESMKLSGWNKFAADVQAKLREKNT
jgi:hypothetical protein